MAIYNLFFQPVLDDLLLAHPLVRAGKMFGYPAYYAGKKLCACLYEEGVGLKLPAASAERLLR
ncbi:MAG: TfoX/Sxy family protein, partial [Ignavibacteria bacterium]|nr:TfoX/Sxy family protein [Ignavibacteria bacterium]